MRERILFVKRFLRLVNRTGSPRDEQTPSYQLVFKSVLKLDSSQIYPNQIYPSQIYELRLHEETNMGNSQRASQVSDDTTLT